MPTHHLHISTGFMFVVALLIMALVTAIFVFISSMRRSKLEAELERERIKADASRPVAARRAAMSSAPRSTFTATPPPPPPMQPSYVVPPAAAPAPVYINNSGNELLTGVLIGEALGGGFGHRDTVIVENNTFVDAPVLDSGIGYDDSGIDLGGDSGGFDIDF
jgi:hypothetical protein